MGISQVGDTGRNNLWFFWLPVPCFIYWTILLKGKSDYHEAFQSDA